MQRGPLISAIIVIVLTILTIINFSYHPFSQEDNINDTTLNPEDIVDNCKDVPSEETIYCKPGTHDCETTITYDARDECYTDLAVLKSDKEICTNIAYVLTKNECVELVQAVLDGAIRGASPIYYQMLADIMKSNDFVLQEDLNDGCFSYRIENQGCKQGLAKDYLTNIGSTKFTEFKDKISLEEKQDLCNHFAHKAAKAYCLNIYVTDEACIEFAGENLFLQRVCGLQKGELMPSRSFGPTEEDKEYTVDTYVPHPFVSYSELVTTPNQNETQEA